MPPDLRRAVIDVLRRVELAVLDAARTSLARDGREQLSRIAAESKGDTIYSLDLAAEEVIVPLLEEGLSPLTSFVLIAEGIADESLVFPRGSAEPEIAVIMDPIDGTRGLLHDKRSAWCLAGAARNAGGSPNIEGIEVAVQTEIPSTRSDRADILWASRGEGASALTLDLENGKESVFTPRPSAASTVRGGFACLARFFPPGRDALASIDDELMRRVLGDPSGRALVFEDQYISTGGQFHQMMTGRDRFLADLRPLVYSKLAAGQRAGLSCHPYDLATALIAREAGVVVRGFPSGRLDSPLDTVTPVAWAAYANRDIQDEIEPVLLDILEERGFLGAEESRKMRETR